MRRETTILTLSTLILVALGALMVYSVSAVSPRLDNVFLKHSIFMGMGLILFMILSHMDYHVLGSKPVFIAIILSALALLFLVLVPGIGTKVDGARRWIRIFGQGFQPSEYARFALVLLLAVKLTQNRANVTKFWSGLLPPFIIAGFFALLVAAERDVGIPAVMMVTAFIMIYVAGARKVYLVGMSGVGFGALVAAIVFFPHRVARIVAFLDPWAYRQGTGWQLIQSLSAFAQGGLWGRGAGAGEQKLGYLPAAHTDFIFASIGEEFGLVGTIVVVFLFVAFSWAALRVAIHALDLFGTMLATGFCTMICFQAAFIMMVTLGMLPTKGLPLPFVSYGGTALMMFLAMAGVLCNIGAQAQPHTALKRPRTVANIQRTPVATG